MVTPGGRRERLQRLEDRDVSVLSVAEVSAALRDVAVIRDRTDSWRRVPSVGGLCLAAHVSERRLRGAFSELFDAPPTVFFREWMLQQARQRLRRVGDDGTTVTDVALDLGFEHLGRFAGCYRQLYGETPSATLRSGARRSA